MSKPTNWCATCESYRHSLTNCGRDDCHRPEPWKSTEPDTGASLGAPLSKRPHDVHCELCDLAEFAGVTYAASHALPGCPYHAPIYIHCADCYDTYLAYREGRATMPVQKWPEPIEAMRRAVLEGFASLDDLIAAVRSASDAQQREWQPIETAPKGGGAEMTTDPAWVDPPRILLRFADGEVSVGYWDWYYAKGGNGCTHGIAWIEPVSGDQLRNYYGEPTHWMPLPPPPVVTQKDE